MHHPIQINLSKTQSLTHLRTLRDRTFYQTLNHCESMLKIATHTKHRYSKQAQLYKRLSEMFATSQKETQHYLSNQLKHIKEIKDELIKVRDNEELFTHENKGGEEQISRVVKQSFSWQICDLACQVFHSQTNQS